MKIAENDRDMLEYLTEACESQVYVCDQCGHEEALATFDIASDLRDYMAAEQRQGEPVAFCWSYKMGGEQRFFPRDPRTEQWGVDMSEYITDVEPLYTHADPGKVERLRNCLRAEVEAGDSWRREAEDLRIQLAERDALLSDTKSMLASELSYELFAKMASHIKRIDAALSASAEPSAPKCKHCQDQGEIHTGKMIDQGYWQPPEPDMEPCPHCQEEPSAPVERDELVSEDELRDMASIACQSALAHGVSEDWFMQLARSVEQRARAALERKP